MSCCALLFGNEKGLPCWEALLQVRNVGEVVRVSVQSDDLRVDLFGEVGLARIVVANHALDQIDLVGTRRMPSKVHNLSVVCVCCHVDHLVELAVGAVRGTGQCVVRVRCIRDRELHLIGGDRIARVRKVLPHCAGAWGARCWVNGVVEAAFTCSRHTGRSKGVVQDGLLAWAV